MAGTNVTAARLRELLTYDPETGVFTRRVRTSNRIKVGDPVGTISVKDGYLRAHVENRLYLMHRLAWLYVHGEWPSKNLDHRDGVGANNRIKNLREGGHEENAQNVVAHRDSRSGLLGVSWHAQANGWTARICNRGKKTNLGMFRTPEEAHAVYLKAKAKQHEFQPVPRDKLNA